MFVCISKKSSLIFKCHGTVPSECFPSEVTLANLCKITAMFRYTHYQMFGTKGTNDKGEVADACSGDSGEKYVASCQFDFCVDHLYFTTKIKDNTLVVYISQPK